MIRYTTKAVNVDGMERLESFIVSSNSNSGSFNYSVHERRCMSYSEIQTEKENKLYKELGIIKCEMH